MAHQPLRPTRRSPTYEQAEEIHRMLRRGMYQHEIASAFGYNQGRISEVKTGKAHPDAALTAFG